MKIHELDRMPETKGKPYWVCTDEERNPDNESAIQQFIDCMKQPSVVKGFMAPDFHEGYVAPIGSVFAVRDAIFPSFVGYDIGCGMSSITIDNVLSSDITTEQWEQIKNQILRDVPIGFYRHKKPQLLGDLVDLKKYPTTDFARQVLLDTGMFQLGTLGGGNHFLEIGSTNSGNIAIVIHSGSRGVGHKIATHYMKKAAIQSIDTLAIAEEFNDRHFEWFKSCKTKEMFDNYSVSRSRYVEARKSEISKNIEDAYPLDVNSQVGKDYINDMNMTLEFALANRKQMIDKCLYAIERILQTDLQTSRFINRNHNHADLKDGLWIHRKGATHAELDMLGVIPGNMVDGSFIVRGLGNEDSMCSSSHGAGRVLSRRKAKDNLCTKEFREDTKHLIANHSDSNLDESPKAYKNIFEVMELQSDLVETLDRITPILNIKG